uniref:Nuclear pore complex protein n=1 Tax=Romanomermis culicivorax TaxID=13658 RepID=A0A915KZP9_ROMCU
MQNSMLGNVTMDFTMNNTAVRRFHENPCDALFNDFKDSLWAAYDVFETLKNFEQLCDDQTSCLQHGIKGLRDPAGLDRAIQTCQLMQAEKVTWRLMLLLLEDRLVRQSQELLSKNSFEEELIKNPSPMQLYQLLQSGHKEFRELLIIIKWCEQSAQDILERESTNLSLLADKTVHWQNTLNEIVDSQSLNQNLITNLDPDAINRGSRRLNDKDVEDENRFLQMCFNYIRSGQLQKAQDLSAHCGQAWRAATFQGGQPFHDPNVRDVKEGDRLFTCEGNKNRTLWKRMCQALSENASCCTLERAIYGSLCGNLNASLLCCKSWMDFLWAYCNSEAEKIFDHCLAKIPESVNGDKMDDDLIVVDCLQYIFKSLESSDYETIRYENMDLFHIVQKFLSLNQPEMLVEYMHSYISSQTNLNNQVLRFMAHVVLILGKCGLNFQNYFGNGILEAYISSLIDEKRLQLVALYTSFLPEDLQINLYSKFLQGIESPNDRQFCLLSAEESGLNLQKICVNVVESIKEGFISDYIDQMTSKIMNSDNAGEMDEDLSNLVASFMSTDDADINEKKLIDSINWLLFYPAHRADAVLQVNCIARRFLIIGNVKVVKKLFSLLPSDSLSLAKQIWLDDNVEMSSDYPELCIDRQNSIREHLCILSYLDAIDSFCEWFEHFHRRAPKSPEPLPTDPRLEVSFVEMAAHEQKMQEYENSLSRWKKILDICTEKATKSLYNVMLFPDGGWLHDKKTESKSENPDDIDERAKHLKILRQKYIPQVCTMILNILKNVGRFKDAIQLADLIAADDRQIYKEFSKDNLRILLWQISQCSTDSLSLDKDTLGYDIEQSDQE